ncbi:MAG: hypothetical protein LBU94_06110, partial [Clostridiales bacterium]|nr:hypothetical protein [Clostridiales bacterium]
MRQSNYNGNRPRKKVKKDIPREQGLLMGKLRFLTFCFVSIILFLSGRVYYIKAKDGAEYEKKAIVQQVSKNDTSRSINPNRGAILDRNRSTQAFAVSTTVYNIFIDNKMLLEEEDKVQQDTVNKISKVLNMTSAELLTSIKESPESQYNVIIKEVDSKTKEALEKEEAKHVYFEEDSKRRYPMGDVAASTIGMIRGDVLSGLEGEYDEYLKGSPGREFRLYDQENNAVTERIPPTMGSTVITTLDMSLEQEAQKLVAKYGEEAQAQHAAILIADPNTGELLTIAEYPSYDLNDPTNIDLVSSDYHRERLLAVPEEERMNAIFDLWRSFSISDTYEPGSIYKPLVVAAALEEGLITENDTFYCSGAKTVAGEVIDCWNLSGHGHLNYKEVLAYSCNVGIMEIIERLGREKYYGYQKDFGIGSSTGIDIGGELQDWRQMVHGISTLGPVELAAAAMGQGNNASPIQMI